LGELPQRCLENRNDEIYDITKDFRFSKSTAGQAETRGRNFGHYDFSSSHRGHHLMACC